MSAEEEKAKQIEQFLDRNLTLDLAGLNKNDRQEGSIALGGTMTKFVEPSNDFDYSKISCVVFRWGDPKAEDIFAVLLEHSNVPDAPVFPFAATTLIARSLWMLALQDKDFDPHTAYRSQEDYCLLPFEELTSQSKLGLYWSLPTPRPQLLGQVGSRYVLFELGYDLDQSTETADVYSHPDTTEVISDEAALVFLEQTIHNWNFDEQTNAMNYWFLINIAHWAVEVFGQKSRDGDYATYPSRRGVPGVELPKELQHLITHSWKNEVFLTDENQLKMRTQHTYIEDDPIIPDWDKISQLSTFNQQLEYIKSHLGVRQNIQPTKIIEIPQVVVQYSPPSYAYGWGLEFVINQLGLSVIPYGEANKTLPAFEYAKQAPERSIELAQVIADLVLLAAQQAPRHSSDVIPLSMIDLFGRRLARQIELPLCGKPTFKPGNSIKNLLIQRLQEEA
jgi:hypothetical protein